MSVYVTFGKYKNYSCERVLAEDPSYCEWVLRTESLNPSFIEAQEELRRLMGRNRQEVRKEQKSQLPWWDVLCCTPTDSNDVVKASWRKLMSQYHPDKCSGLGVELKELADKKSQEINRAYEQFMLARGL